MDSLVVSSRQLIYNKMYYLSVVVVHALHCASSHWPLLLLLWLLWLLLLWLLLLLLLLWLLWLLLLWLLWLLLLWLLWLAACPACCCCSRSCTLGCDDSLGGLQAYWWWCCCAKWAQNLHVLVEDHALVAAVFCTAHRTLGPRQT